MMPGSRPEKSPRKSAAMSCQPAQNQAILKIVMIVPPSRDQPSIDRKSTRLNSSHVEISYAVFCLKKKKEKKRIFLSYPQIHVMKSKHNTIRKEVTLGMKTFVPSPL